ncbi:hypothetical protein ACN28E_25045 [Archangium lansingense]|uniref:hypothetical protein n=1 Tax=Archangium lansingense TaxID=2995310 RepID=UPI003B80EA06
MNPGVNAAFKVARDELKTNLDLLSAVREAKQNTRNGQAEDRLLSVENTVLEEVLRSGEAYVRALDATRTPVKPSAPDRSQHAGAGLIQLPPLPGVDD